MAIAPDFSEVEIQGVFIRADGTPSTGEMSATPSTVYYNTTTGKAVDRAPRGAVLNASGVLVAAELNSSGQWVATNDGDDPYILAATNDPTTAPLGVTVRIVGQLDGVRFALDAVVLDYATPTVRFVDLLPLVDAPVPTWGVLGLVEGTLIRITSANGVYTVALDTTGAALGDTPHADGVGGVAWGPEAGGGDLHYTHTQSIAATVWTVPHGLGKYPAVHVTDSGGSRVTGLVHDASINQLTIQFSAATSGSAYCN